MSHHAYLRTMPINPEAIIKVFIPWATRDEYDIHDIGERLDAAGFKFAIFLAATDADAAPMRLPITHGATLEWVAGNVPISTVTVMR